MAQNRRSGNSIARLGKAEPKRCRGMKPGGLAVFLAAWFSAISPVPSNAGHDTRDVPTIATDRLKLLLDAGEKLLLVDIRPVKEFQEKRLPGARSIPAAELEGR